MTCFSAGLLSPPSAGLWLGCCMLCTSKPACTGGVGPHPAPRCGAHPRHPEPMIATKRKRAERITDLADWLAEQGVSGRESRQSSSYLPFYTTPRGTRLLLHLIFPPWRCESCSFLLMTCSCRSCSIIDLRQGWCGWKLVWVFPTVSAGLFKDKNSSSRASLAVGYINERSPSSPP